MKTPFQPRPLVGLATQCFVVLLLTGCGTPMAVKRLSAEQAQVVTNYQQSLKAYFDVIERFADAQEKAADVLIDLTMAQIQSDLKKNAVDAVAGDTAAKRKAVNELTASVQDNVVQAESRKAQIRDLVAKLKQKDAEMLQAHSAIVSAQDKLNEYIQMKKADEAVLDQLTAMVGVNRDKLNQAAGDTASIATEIQKVAGVITGAKQ